MEMIDISKIKKNDSPQTKKTLKDLPRRHPKQVKMSTFFI